MQNPPGVGEKEEVHDDEAADHGKDDHPAHDRLFEFQVHEILNDQRRLDHGQQQKHLQHAYRLEDLTVPQPDLDPSQNQKRAPYPEILTFAVVVLGHVMHGNFLAGTTSFAKPRPLSTSDKLTEK